MALAWGFMGLQLALTGVLRASGNMMTDHGADPDHRNG